VCMYSCKKLVIGTISFQLGLKVVECKKTGDIVDLLVFLESLLPPLHILIPFGKMKIDLIAKGCERNRRRAKVWLEFDSSSRGV
jgi:hypothetical protein